MSYYNRGKLSFSGSGNTGSSRYTSGTGTSGYTASVYAAPSYASSGSGSSYGGSTYGSGTGSSYAGSYTPGTTRSAYAGTTPSYSTGAYSSSTHVPTSTYTAPYTSARAATDYTTTTRRSLRDRSVDRALATPHNTRRSLRETTVEYTAPKLSDVSRSHVRSDSSSSVTSFDAVFDDSKSMNNRKRSVKRDLEQILGHDDHLLVQRIIAENKEMFKETELELSPEEKILVQRISDACRTGIEVNCSEILKIVSHQTAAVM